VAGPRNSRATALVGAERPESIAQRPHQTDASSVRRGNKRPVPLDLLSYLERVVNLDAEAAYRGFDSAVKGSCPRPLDDGDRGGSEFFLADLGGHRGGGKLFRTASDDELCF
jgi:hypothetical protein